MGSGKYLKRAIEKHGIENFTKEILFVFDNPEDMYAKEAELVNEDFLTNENTYNLKVGGFGGWDFVNASGKNNLNRKTRKVVSIEKHRKTINERIKNYGLTEKELNRYKEISKTLTKKYSFGEIVNGFKGKTHSQETKDNIGLKTSASQKGEGNSQFGTMWITDGIESIKIKKTDNIPEGYVKGRKFK